jgi:cytochrome c biogenesis protein CcmG/thiol:disulfide interchange protein DsbE
MLGVQLPPFEAETIDGHLVSVPGYLTSKVTVIDFWASWCASCRETLPALDALWREQREAGLQVIGMSLDEHRIDATRGALELGATFPIVHDQEQQFASTFRISQVPTTFVLDRKGAVRWVGSDPASVRRVAIALLEE